IGLVMNRDTTLLARDIEAEGKNFDVSSLKRPRYDQQYSNWADISWYDGREASRALTACMEPCLQSVIQSVETIPPKSNTLSPDEIKIIAQLDT
ncbi:33934_t:CDS:2, partial [Racocetra persica]